MRPGTPARACLVAGALLVALAGSGCQLAALFGGHGKQAAEYHLPKGKRVLVMVDVRPELAAPPVWSSSLAEDISSEIFQNKGTDMMAGQEKLLDLRRDPRFAKMGVPDIAQACNVDIVVLVYVVELQVTTTVDQSVTQGTAMAFVKVIDKNGNRLWGDTLGRKVEAQVEPALQSDRDRDAVYKILHDQLKIRVARLFFDYDLEDKHMTQYDFQDRKSSL
jgi:hypothetical protein